MSPILAHQVTASAPSSAFLKGQLPEIAEGLRAMLVALQSDPHPASLETAAIRLEGARKHVQLLAEALRSEP